VISVVGQSDYRQGGGVPLEHTTVEPGGTTIVVLFLGGDGSLLLKLRQPPSVSGSRRHRRRVACMTGSPQKSL
jgi:hypothetical protein